MRMEGVELMPFDKSSYDKEYAKKHITRKFIPFNDTVEQDAEILAWLATKENVTAYVKQLITDDMNRNTVEISDLGISTLTEEMTKIRSQLGSQTGN